MTLVPQREYLVLLIGDACVFVATLWIALALRAFTFPAWDVFVRHLVPFSILFIAWALVFFVAGLYGRHTRLFRSALPSKILYALLCNILLAALFFFFVPVGLAPKTILVLRLCVLLAVFL